MAKDIDRPLHYKIIRYLLFGFNLLFLIFGATFIGIGVWIRVDEDSFYSVVSKGSPLGPAALMITVGCVVFLLSLVGCLGALKEHRWLLIGFSSVLFIIFIAEIVLISLAVVFRNEIEDYTRDTLTNSIKKSYDESGESALTVGINRMQEKFQCCGVLNYTDWTGSKWAEKNPTARVPKSCCKNAQGEPNCHLVTSSIQGIYTKPCLEELKQWAKDHLVIIAAIGGVVAFIGICGIFMALGMITHIKQGSYV